MAAVSTLWKNILEVSQHFHNGKVLPEINLLAQENQVVMDIPWKMCNDGTGHKYRLTTALPVAEKVAHGEGTTESKSQGAMERATCTMISGFSTVPRTTIMTGGAKGELRAREDALFAESLKQLFARSIFYDNRALSLKDIYGFMTLYSTLSGVKAKNVINCGGATPNGQTSAVIVNWGEDVYGVFPEGLPAGYNKIDHGLVVEKQANGKKLSVFSTEHEWHFGLVVEAWPSVVRICNIDVANAVNLTGNQAPSSFLNVIHAIIRGKNRLRRPGRAVCYVNDLVFELLMRIAFEKSSQAVKCEEAITQFGTFQELRILGMPVRKSDQILLSEPVVS